MNVIQISFLQTNMNSQNHTFWNNQSTSYFTIMKKKKSIKVYNSKKLKKANRFNMPQPKTNQPVYPAVAKPCRKGKDTSIPICTEGSQKPPDSQQPCTCWHHSHQHKGWTNTGQTWRSMVCVSCVRTDNVTCNCETRGGGREAAHEQLTVLLICRMVPLLVTDSFATLEIVSANQLLITPFSLWVLQAIFSPPILLLTREEIRNYVWKLSWEYPSVFPIIQKHLNLHLRN